MDKKQDSEFHSLNERVTRLEKAVAENTKITSAISSDTSELLELFRAARGGFKVVGWLGSFLKWVIGIGGAIMAGYVAIQQARGH